MTRWPRPGRGDAGPEHAPVDPAAVEHDAQLLDLLAAGEQPRDPDRAVRLLAALRDAADHPSDAIRRDDLLLDALGRAEPTARTDRAAALLAALRAASEALPAARLGSGSPAGPFPIRSTRRRPARLGRHGVAVAAAAAIALGSGGLAAAAVTAAPGSFLYPLHQLLTGGPARRPAAPHATARAVDLLLDATQRALAQGQLSLATADLAAARHLLAQVRAPATTLTRLTDRLKTLDAQLRAASSQPAQPAEGARPRPARPTPAAAVGSPSAAGRPPTTATPSPTPPAASPAPADNGVGNGGTPGNGRGKGRGKGPPGSGTGTGGVSGNGRRRPRGAATGAAPA
ncbi:MAG TPA: hypothetical protein VNG13_06070 [Mycobacteriales bacterium]|nr:hypothetical protein [Mycobacteriales bacterium]